MTTPTQTNTLKLFPEDAPDSGSPSRPHRGLDYASTLQQLLRFELREEGAHTLAVSVTYETTSTLDGAITGRRTRSFRKLYQFAAVPCLSVRTKATDLIPSALAESRDRGLEKGGESFALEAQLENLTDGPLTLEEVAFEARAPWVSTSLNWDAVVGEMDEDEGEDGAGVEKHLTAPTLAPGAVTQVCYLIGEDEMPDGAAKGQKEMTKDGRFVLGALSIKWRGAMGEPGVLSTGWLTSRRR